MKFKGWAKIGKTIQGEKIMPIYQCVNCEIGRTLDKKQKECHVCRKMIREHHQEEAELGIL